MMHKLVWQKNGWSVLTPFLHFLQISFASLQWYGKHNIKTMSIVIGKTLYATYKTKHTMPQRQTFLQLHTNDEQSSNIIVETKTVYKLQSCVWVSFFSHVMKTQKTNRNTRTSQQKKADYDGIWFVAKIRDAKKVVCVMGKDIPWREV